MPSPLRSTRDRSNTHAQLAQMSFDEFLSLTAGGRVFFFFPFFKNVLAENRATCSLS